MGNHLSYPITTLHIDRVNHTHFAAAAVSMHGWRLTMEDQHNIIPDVNGKGVSLFGVYDGHGGPAAAQYISENIQSAFSQLEDIGDKEAITKIMLDLDKQFLEKDCPDGSTVCLVLVQPCDKATKTPLETTEGVNPDDVVFRAVGVNLGDSRAIVVKKDGGFISLTDDHKPEDPEELERISKAGGYVNNGRVDGSLALSRAIGDSPYKDSPDLPPEEQKVIAVPTFNEGYIEVGDSLLVACDGIFESAQLTTRDSVVEFLHRSIAYHAKEAAATSEEAVAENLWDPAVPVRDVIAASITNDSHDNHSGILAHFRFTTAQPDLPERECVPGPFHSVCDDDNFRTTYHKDLSDNGFDFFDPDMRKKIDAVDEYYESLDSDYVESIYDLNTVSEVSLKPVIVKVGVQKNFIASQLREWFSHSIRHGFEEDDE